MSDRGRSTSPRPIRGGDMDVDSNGPSQDNKDAKVVVVTNLTRNVVESHLQTIFGFYGQILKVDLPLYGKSGQNRGKAAVEFAEAGQAQKAVVHMNGGQLDGAMLKVELSVLPIYHRSRSRSHSRSPRSVSRSRSGSRSRTKSRSPPRRNGRARLRSYSRSRSPLPAYRKRGGRGGRGGFGRRGAPRDFYRPVRSRSRSRSRSPVRRANDRLVPRRRSPSYTRGGYARGRSLTKSRSRSYSVRSSRSRSRSFSRSRSRTRSMSYSSYSRYSRSRSRSRSVSRRRRSASRDDIRDSRSRSPT